MIASKPVRLLSLVIVAVVVVSGIRAMIGGLTSADRLDSPARSETSGERTVGKVTRVLDGDTVEVVINDGRDVRVRMLGISAPELPHPGKPGECYGHASARHLKQLLPAGTRVTLVSDPTQDDVDRYGRRLRYVLVEGRDVGATHVRTGAAGARDSSTPVSRHALYAQLEANAREHRAGMWTTCR